MEPQKEKPNFNYAVNGFRGLCIIMVFLFHIENSGILPDVNFFEAAYDFLRYFVSLFKYGVEMFFMISGYVIMGSLKRHSTAKAFLIDRALRIYPTWVPLHILSFMAGPVIKRGIFETYDPLRWTIAFFTNLFFLPPVLAPDLVHPAAWSLSYEWTFYVVAAVAMFAIPKFFGRLGIMIFIGLAGALLIDLFPRGLFFVPGVILALYEDKFRQCLGRFRFPALGLLAFLFAWGGTEVEAAELTTFIHEWIFDDRIVYAIVAFVTGTYMFAGVVLNQGQLSKWLHVPFMQFYGKISYAFYLWSPVAMMVTKIIAVKLTPYIGPWGALGFFSIVSFMISTIVSWLNWKLIETWLTGMIKKRLKNGGRHAS